MDLSIYQGHNASVSFFIDGKYHVIELEKFCNSKNLMLIDQGNAKVEEILDSILSLLKNTYGFDGQIKTLLLGKDWPQVDNIIIDKLKPNVVKYFDHQLGHAYCSFIQSEFEKSLIISYDGGGNDGSFNCYIGDKKNGQVVLQRKFPLNLGVPYYRSGYPISEIGGKTGLMVDDLKIAGKLMGLVGYGEQNDEYYDELIKFYFDFDYLTDFREKDSLSEQESFDYAYCTQKLFENTFLEYFYNVLFHLGSKLGNNRNVCLTGGCALNVLMNQRLMNQGFNVFVPPNPDDGGLSLGFLFQHRNENKQQEIVFNGIPILDASEFGTFLSTRKHDIIDVSDLVKEIDDGKIIGIIEGEGEVGPRALGRRSIICNPSIADMKDILNNKVKFREWFRPFAPVVRDKDYYEFFHVKPEQAKNFKFMSFAPRVKEKYKELLPAITHVDGTSRLQIIYDQNETIYKVLDEMEKQNKIPVLINTSFNMKGKPTLTSYNEAFNILDSTDLDYVYSKGFLFS